MIIFLNGVGSSGKTTVGRALQHLSPMPLLMLGIDTFYNMMPAKYVGNGERASEGWQFVDCSDDRGRIVSVQSGEYGQRVSSSSPKVVRTLAEDGHDLIVDEVLLGDELLKKYVELLKDQRVYFIAIDCPLEILEERELLRSDRALGLARDQIQRVHGPTRQYDLRVNTAELTPFKCAHEILNFIDMNPKPKAFTQLESTL